MSDGCCLSAAGCSLVRLSGCCCCPCCCCWCCFCAQLLKLCDYSYARYNRHAEYVCDSDCDCLSAATTVNTTSYHYQQLCGSQQVKVKGVAAILAQKVCFKLAAGRPILCLWHTHTYFAHCALLCVVCVVCCAIF